MNDAPPEVQASVNDSKRLDALNRTYLLDSPNEQSFDKETAKIREELNVPVSLISLVDQDRQFFKSQQGMSQEIQEKRETPLTHSVCQHVVNRKSTVVIGDMREYPMFRNHAALQDLNVVAYLGEPLLYDGEVIGSVCAIDTKPRKWNDEEIEMLRARADEIRAEIDAFAQRNSNGEV